MYIFIYIYIYIYTYYYYYYNIYTVRFLISAFLIESVALSSKCLLIVIQITRLYIWRWTPGPAQAHGLSGGCRAGPGTGRAWDPWARPWQPPLRPWAWAGPGVHRQIYKRVIRITKRRHFEENATGSIQIISNMSCLQLKQHIYIFGAE